MLHSIRLHGPWQAIQLPAIELEKSVPNLEGSAALIHEKILLPDQWMEFQRRSNGASILLERAFGLPTGLDPDQQVWLVIEANRLRADVFLNDERLGELGADESQFRRSVRPYLLTRNRLRMAIDLKPGNLLSENCQPLSDGSSIDEVRLEITG